MSEQNNTDNKSVPLMLRLPADLHAKIKKLAAKNRRSLNSQCIVLLEDAVSILEDDESSDA